ncbi:MAG: hypothetical protein AVDCRST_MAG53-971, partial [uncultured Solirubrobacteraceae bacterium]
GHPGSRAAPAPPRARRDRRRRLPGGRELRLLLEGDDVLLDRRTDDLPPRVRLRLRHAGLRGRRLRLRRLRRHGHSRDGGAVLQRVSCDVRDLRQAPLPAHLRRDPRRARRRRGARHRRGAVDRGARRRLRVHADARRDPLRPGPVARDAPRAVRRLRHRPRLRLLRDLRRRGRVGDRELQLHRQRGAHPAVPGGGDVLSDRRAPAVGAGRRGAQPAAPLCRARARLRVRLEAGNRRPAAARACALRPRHVAHRDQPDAEAADRL